MTPPFQKVSRHVNIELRAAVLHILCHERSMDALHIVGYEKQLKVLKLPPSSHFTKPQPKS